VATPIKYILPLDVSMIFLLFLVIVATAIRKFRYLLSMS